MGLKWGDKIRETTAVTGTGAATLLGAASQCFAFSSFLSDGDTTDYFIRAQSGSEEEWGVGTYSSSGNSIARTTVKGGSNGTSAVNFSAGTKDIYCFFPAWRATTVFAPQLANQVLAGPSSGGSAVPAYRALATADIPALSYDALGAAAAAQAASQPLDADLTAIAALATTSFGRGGLTQTDAGSFRSYIGAGTGSGNGDALTANPLSQFAATTSAQLAGVMSDETGTGKLVFATSPTLVTPLLGTPTSGNLANCTGLPESGVTNLTNDLAFKAPLASPALTGTPTTPTAVPSTSNTQIASTAYADAAVAAAVTGLLDFKGSTDCSGNPNYPAASKGDAYVVSVAGKIGGASGAAVDVGDVYFATADNAGGTQAAVGSSWDILEHNLQGALLSANNLSDVASTTTARTNLGVPAGSGTSTGTNTGDQTTIVGITGTLAQFNTACTDADFARTDAAQTFTGTQTVSGGRIEFPATPGSGDVGQTGGGLTMGYYAANYGWIQTWNSTPLMLNPSGNGVQLGTVAVTDSTNRMVRLASDIWFIWQPTTSLVGSGDTSLLRASVGNVGFTDAISVTYATIGKSGLTLTPAVRTSGSAAFTKFITPADTTQTASTESLGMAFGGTNANPPVTVTRQFATGNITTQREYVFTAPTYGFVAASTITTPVTLEITGPPITGTNATFTNPYALRIGSGNINIGGSSSLVVAGTFVINTSASNTDISLSPGLGNVTVITSSGQLRVNGSGGVALIQSANLTWSNSTAPATTPDTGIGRNAAGVVEINVAAAGSFAALICGQPTTSTVGLKVKGAASATADKFQGLKSDNTVECSIGPTGYPKWAGSTYLTSDVTNATATMGNIQTVANCISGVTYSGIIAVPANDSQATEGLKFDFNGGSATFSSVDFGFIGVPLGATLGTAYSTALGTAITVTTATTVDVQYFIAFSGVCNGSGTLILRGAQVSHTLGTATFRAGAFGQIQASF